MLRECTIRFVSIQTSGIFASVLTAAVPLPAHNRTLKEWQLLTIALDPTNDRFVVVSGKAAFGEDFRLADILAPPF